MGMFSLPTGPDLPSPSDVDYSKSVGMQPMGASPSTYTPSWLPQTSNAIPQTLNQNPQGSAATENASSYQPQSFSHGGQVHPMQRGQRGPRGMIAAHFNPQELGVLQHAQGFNERYAPDGIASLKGLEGLVGNPHIKNHIHRHLAQGGMGAMSPANSQDGRHGDTELAYIGPHLRELLDKAAHHRTHNPTDGHPEYFSLGGLFSGLGNAITSIPGIGGMLGSVGKTLLPMAGGALGTMFGGPMGGMMGSQLAGSLGNSMFGNSAGGQAQYNPNASAGSNLMQGGLSSLGSYFGQNGSQLGNGFNAAAQAMGNGQNLMGAGKSAFSAMGGLPALMNAGRTAFDAYRGGGQSPMASMRAGLNNYTGAQYGPQQMPQGYSPPQSQYADPLDQQAGMPFGASEGGYRPLPSAPPQWS